MSANASNSGSDSVDYTDSSSLIINRPLHTKIFFATTVAGLSFTLYALFRIFRSTQLSQPLQTVQWQRLRMVGQAGIIGGLTGPLVWEGLGFDTWKLRAEREGTMNKRKLDFVLGLFGRTTETV